MKKAVLKNLLFALTTCCMLLVTNAYAGSYQLVPGQPFYRDSGAPVTEILSFNALDTASSYTVNIYNGGLEDYEVVGEYVSSSTIKLNGDVLFAPNEFNQNTSHLSKTVNVNASNQMEVTLKGKPGGVIIIEIIGEDDVPPQISATVTPLANAAGWHNDQVVVSYTCSDGASGIASCPDDEIVTIEGATQTITGTAVDVAGNQATATVTLNIDLTLPDINAAAEPAANPNNWNNTAVTVNYTCSDALSGVASCSPPVSVSTEGANQTVSGQVSDVADNSATTTHTLNIDLTPPTIAHSLSLAANPAGWHREDVTVSYQCNDALSGYTNCPTPVTLSTEGAAQTISGTVLDNADNSATDSVVLNLDKTQPLVTSIATPAANNNGWHNSAATVSFDCQDPLSGVAECSPAVTLSAEGANQIINGQGKDIAGNTLAINHTLNIDLTPPLISTSLSAAANANGWHNNDVTTTFTCSDLLSGYDVCPAPFILTTEGSAQAVTGTVTDRADNTSSTTINLSLDKTPPAMSSSATPLANAAGWNSSEVTVSFDCQDTLSGVSSCSAPVVVNTEGANQAIPGQSVDMADNVTNVEHTLNIDLTPPLISTALSLQPNAAGWHNQDVTVSFVCDDPQSGYADCPLPQTVTSEGNNQSISGTVFDIAGNTSSASVALNIDKTAPVVTPTQAPTANAAGWNNTAVAVNFDCQDTLSGVVDCTPPVDLSLEGANQSVTGEGRDVADNITSVNQLLNIDLTPPAISAQLSTPANAAGWHNSDLTIAYTCSDALSGIASCPTSDSLLTEGSNQTITASAVDNADNSSADSVVINLDKTPPTVTATSVPAANANGWHQSAVTVSFNCQDTLSGVASCSPPVSLSTEGANQAVNGQGSDIADNSAQTLATLNIDLTAPTISTQFSATANAAGWYNSPVTLSFICDDTLSGVQTCPADITVTNDVSGHIINVTADDRAGNSISQQHVINLDTTAPNILFTAPTTGVELASLQPIIEFTLSDNTAIDETSLVLTINGLAFPGNCAIGTDGATVCTPNSDLPRGAIQLQASVSDLAGNSTNQTHDFRIQEDRDNDGVPDIDDLFPDDPTEWADLDGDGIGDNSDPDIDGDGISNDYETQAGTDPNDASSVPPDFDSDGIPDSLDGDVDGDGVPNAQDIFPNDPGESADLDGDGIGDNADTDRDGDGFSNDEEIQAGSNPDDANDIPGGNLRISFSPANPTSSDAQFVNLAGTVYGDSVDRVYLTSDQYGSTPFAATVSNNSWTSRVALKLGANQITAHVEGNTNEASDATVSIQRTEPPPVLELVFDTPANNSLVDTPNVVVTGRVISETAVERPQVSVNNVTAQVTQGGSVTEFNFSAGVTLTEGSNTILASTTIAGQLLQESLTLNYQPETTQVLPPAVGIISPTPGTTLTTDSFVLNARVSSDAGIASITVNGLPETASASGQLEKTFSFAGQSQLDINIVATDNLGQSSTLNASYTLDTDAPLIQVDALLAYPDENTLTENPYKLSGSVTDATLLQLTLNGQALALEPAATPDSYDFEANVVVPAGISTSLVFEAVDAAGNSRRAEYLVTANSSTQIEWLTPAHNANILLEGSGQLLPVSARLNDVTGIAGAQVEIVDHASPPLILTLDSGIASGQITLPDVTGEYVLRLSVLDANDAILSRSSRTINLQLAEDIPLSIIKITPEDEATDAEPNDFVAVFFNRPVELNKLSIELNETAHGFSYIDADSPGVDSLHAKGYVLEEVNRDYAPLPGVYSLLADNTTAVFYPQRDMAYDADMYITVQYDGEEMARRHFKVRPRPTFIEGAIADNLTQPVSGVEVSIPELGRTAITDKDGAYSFGYADSADQNLPDGKFRITVNAALKDHRFGAYEGFINIQNGTQNQIGIISLPLLNPDIAFSYLNSGTTNVNNGGELNLDATNASFGFANGRSEGAAHIQFLTYNSVQKPVFKTDYMPLWAYGVQPVGIKVQGDLQLDFALPKYRGSYDYAPPEGELVVLLGMDENNTNLIPVGVGKAVAGHRIESVGETHFNRLDFISYARVTFEQWSDLTAYAQGEMSIAELTLKLQTYVYVPPANEAEAEARLKAVLGQ